MNAEFRGVLSRVHTADVGQCALRRRKCAGGIVRWYSLGCANVHIHLSGPQENGRDSVDRFDRFCKV